MGDCQIKVVRQRRGETRVRKRSLKSPLPFFLCSYICFARFTIITSRQKGRAESIRSCKIPKEVRSRPICQKMGGKQRSQRNGETPLFLPSNVDQRSGGDQHLPAKPLLAVKSKGNPQMCLQHGPAQGGDQILSLCPQRGPAQRGRLNPQYGPRHLPTPTPPNALEA